jgi:hypothetical protein
LETRGRAMRRSAPFPRIRSRARPTGVIPRARAREVKAVLRMGRQNLGSALRQQRPTPVGIGGHHIALPVIRIHRNEDRALSSRNAQTYRRRLRAGESGKSRNLGYSRERPTGWHVNGAITEQHVQQHFQPAEVVAAAPAGRSSLPCAAPRPW